MKSATELRSMSDVDLEKELLTLRKDQFKFAMKKASGSLEKTHVVKSTRRTIAKIKTIKAQRARTKDDN